MNQHVDPTVNVEVPRKGRLTVSFAARSMLAWPLSWLLWQLLVYPKCLGSFSTGWLPCYSHKVPAPSASDMADGSFTGDNPRLTIHELSPVLCAFNRVGLPQFSKDKQLLGPASLQVGAKKEAVPNEQTIQTPEELPISCGSSRCVKGSCASIVW